MTPPRMPSPIAAPVPDPPASAVVGIAVSDTAASAPAIANPRPSLLTRVFTQGRCPDFGSGRVSACLVDMALSSLPDPTRFCAGGRISHRPDVGRQRPERHVRESSASLAHRPATSLLQMPASWLAHVPDTFTLMLKRRPVRLRGDRCGVVDYQLHRVTAAPPVAAQMPGDVHRGAACLGEKMAKRRLGDPEGDRPQPDIIERVGEDAAQMRAPDH